MKRRMVSTIMMLAIVGWGGAAVWPVSGGAAAVAAENRGEGARGFGGGGFGGGGGARGGGGGRGYDGGNLCRGTWSRFSRAAAGSRGRTDVGCGSAFQK